MKFIDPGRPAKSAKDIIGNKTLGTVRTSYGLEYSAYQEDGRTYYYPSPTSPPIPAPTELRVTFKAES